MKQKSASIAKQENVFFFAAIFAILVAGDIIWWQSKQMSDDFEYSNAAIYSVGRSDVQVVESMGQSIDKVEADIEQELLELEFTAE